ncbi:39987_t:CDS:2 [Gigaspora margarita]|uniref:39987_t:CDS:1 n=1 Tax=Gigaspora margarita TaxID=4874 RepID=A0ABN7V4J0_GIGMA|nr:39987_t:CDS:2 [Gigaspora margarita]
MTKAKRTSTRRMTVPGGEIIDRKPLTAFNQKLIRDLNIAVCPNSKPKNPSNSAPSANSSLYCHNAIDFSKMETNDLVTFSTQLGTLLFGNRNTNNHKSNVMSISNILAH